MAFKIHPLREHTIDYYKKEEDGSETSFSLQFKFPSMEEVSIQEMTKILETQGIKDLTEANPLAGVFTGLYLKRKGLIGWKDIFNAETGEEIPFNEQNQKIIFDIVFGIKEVREKIEIAFSGMSLKNLKSGVMPASTGDGDQKPVDHAS
jgi:hypothetical protein